MNIKIIPASLLCFFIILLSFIPLKAAGITANTITENTHALQQTADLFSRIIANAKPAVVYIQVKNKQEPAANATKNAFYDDPVLRDFFKNEDRKEKDSSFFDDSPTFGFGSGFLVNADGYILTNSHVLANAVEVTVTMADKSKHTAKIIGSDKATDIGLLKIDKRNLPALPLGDSDSIKAGEWVLAIGSPFAFIQTATAGIISATGRNSIGISDYESFIQTDAAINPGNSGGPLINIHGKVIGINTAFLTQTGGYIGIGFAIPINIARKVAEQLQRDGKVTRAWLGVALLDATAEQLQKQGLPSTLQAAWIDEVTKNSPAARAGLQKNDVITTINHTPITGAADLRNRISLDAPQSEVTIEYYRNSVKNTTKTVLGTLAP